MSNKVVQGSRPYFCSSATAAVRLTLNERPQTGLQLPFTTLDARKAGFELAQPSHPYLLRQWKSRVLPSIQGLVGREREHLEELGL